MDLNKRASIGLAAMAGATAIAIVVSQTYRAPAQSPAAPVLLPVRAEAPITLVCLTTSKPTARDSYVLDLNKSVVTGSQLAWLDPIDGVWSAESPVEYDVPVPFTVTDTTISWVIDGDTSSGHIHSRTELDRNTLAMTESYQDAKGSRFTNMQCDVRRRRL